MGEKQQVKALADLAVTCECVWDKKQGRTRPHQKPPQSVSLQPYHSITVPLEGVPMYRRVQSELQAGVEHSRAEALSLVGENKLDQPA